MSISSMSEVQIQLTEVDFAIDELNSPIWQLSEPIEISLYWNGKPAPDGHRSSAAMLWSGSYLYVRFVANQTDALIQSVRPNVLSKTIGLWERDVCEIFVAPDQEIPERYFEFEIAPNGEWIDLGIDITPDGRKTDLDYASGMTSAARVDDDVVIMAIKIPFSSLGRTPKDGDVWLGNLFRCVGKDPGRGYLAWMPTMTAVPNFHIPERFGRFVFTRK